MKPDDITDEEWDAAHRAYFRRNATMRQAVAAQNALRDQRVAKEAARAERERITREIIEAYRDLAKRADGSSYDEGWLDALDITIQMISAFPGHEEKGTDALRGEGDAPDPAPCPDCGGEGRSSVGHTPTKEKP